MPRYRTLDNLEEDYFRSRPEEIEPYLHEFLKLLQRMGILAHCWLRYERLHVSKAFQPLLMKLA